MSTVSAAAVTMVVLSVSGLMPAAALVGPRLLVVPLLPLAGAVLVALAATGLWPSVGVSSDGSPG